MSPALVTVKAASVTSSRVQILHSRFLVVAMKRSRSIRAATRFRHSPVLVAELVVTGSLGSRGSRSGAKLRSGWRRFRRPLPVPLAVPTSRSRGQHNAEISCWYLTESVGLAHRYAAQSSLYMAGRQVRHTLAQHPVCSATLLCLVSLASLCKVNIFCELIAALCLQYRKLYDRFDDRFDVRFVMTFDEWYGRVFAGFMMRGRVIPA